MPYESQIGGETPSVQTPVTPRPTTTRANLARRLRETKKAQQGVAPATPASTPKTSKIPSGITSQKQQQINKLVTTPVQNTVAQEQEQKRQRRLQVAQQQRQTRNRNVVLGQVNDNLQQEQKTQQEQDRQNRISQTLGQNRGKSLGELYSSAAQQTGGGRTFHLTSSLFNTRQELTDFYNTEVAPKKQAAEEAEAKYKAGEISYEEYNKAWDELEAVAARYTPMQQAFDAVYYTNGAETAKDASYEDLLSKRDYWTAALEEAEDRIKNFDTRSSDLKYRYDRAFEEYTKDPTKDTAAKLNAIISEAQKLEGERNAAVFIYEQMADDINSLGGAIQTAYYRENPEAKWLESVGSFDAEGKFVPEATYTDVLDRINELENEALTTKREDRRVALMAEANWYRDYLQTGDMLDSMTVDDVNRAVTDAEEQVKQAEQALKDAQKSGRMGDQDAFVAIGMDSPLVSEARQKLTYAQNHLDEMQQYQDDLAHRSAMQDLSEDTQDMLRYLENHTSTWRATGAAAKQDHTSEEAQLRQLGVGGNVDLTSRPVIDSKELSNAGWDEAGEGEAATVYSSTYTNEAGNKAANFTPIMVDENGQYTRVLPPEELQRYAEGVLSGAHDDYLKLQMGGAFTGQDAIEKAEQAAETIHSLHAEVFADEIRALEGRAEPKAQYSDLGDLVSHYGLTDPNMPGYYEEATEFLRPYMDALMDDGLSEDEAKGILGYVGRKANEKRVADLKQATLIAAGGDHKSVTTPDSVLQLDDKIQAEIEDIINKTAANITGYTEDGEYIPIDSPETLLNSGNIAMNWNQLEKQLLKEGMAEDEIARIRQYVMDAAEAKHDDSRHWLGNWLLSVGNSLASGVGYVDLMNQFGWAGVDPYTGRKMIDYNSAANDFYQRQMAYGEEQMQRFFNRSYDAVKAEGDTEEERILSAEELAQKKAQTAMNFYNLTQSMGQSISIAGLTKLGISPALILLSGASATQTTQEMHEKGYSDGAALMGGFVAGLAEYVTEKYSMESLFKNLERVTQKNLTRPQMVREFLVGIGLQGAGESSEEGASDLMNRVFDELIGRYANGGVTQIEMDALQKQRANPELSWDEALTSARQDWTKQFADDVEAGLWSGLLMGGGSGVLGEAIGAVKTTSEGRGLSEEAKQALFDKINSIDQDLAGLNNLKPVNELKTDYQLGQAMRQLSETYRSESVMKRLAELGETNITPNLISAIETTAQAEGDEGGHRLLPSEKRALERSQYGQQVIAELSQYKTAEQQMLSELGKDPTVAQMEAFYADQMGTDYSWAARGEKNAMDNRLAIRNATGAQLPTSFVDALYDQQTGGDRLSGDPKTAIENVLQSGVASRDEMERIAKTPELRAAYEEATGEKLPGTMSKVRKQMRQRLAPMDASVEQQQYMRTKAANPDAVVLGSSATALEQAGMNDAGWAHEQGQILDAIFNGEDVSSYDLTKLDLNNPAVRQVFGDRTMMTNLPARVSYEVKKAAVERAIDEVRKTEWYQAAAAQAAEQIQEQQAKATTELKQSVERMAKTAPQTGNINKWDLVARNRANRAAREQEIRDNFEARKQAAGRYRRINYRTMTEREVLDRVKESSGVRDLASKSMFADMYRMEHGITGAMSDEQLQDMNARYDRYLINQGLNTMEREALNGVYQYHQLRGDEVKTAPVDPAKRLQRQIRRGEGKVILEDGINKDNLLKDKLRGPAYHVLERLAENLGVTFHLYETREVDGKGRVWVDKDGRDHTDNGWYDPNTGEIWIDINASKEGKGLILFTAAHELTHWMRDYSPEKFDILANFVLDKYAGRGVPVRALIKNKIALAADHNLTLSEDEAMEEVVADSMEAMLADGNVAQMLEELRQTDTETANTVVRFLKTLFNQVKKLYRDLRPDSLEGKLVMQMGNAFKDMQRMFAEGLAEASERYHEGNVQLDNEQSGVVADAGSQSAVMFSARYAPTTAEEAEQVAQTLSNTLGVSMEKARAWVQSETSIANLVLSEGNEVLDYEPDARYTAIKNNSDYPQGTVDFSTLCRKRRVFTDLFGRLQREYPNRVFTADDLEKIRQILIDEDITVACGLCFVEERRQRMGEIAQDFIDGMKDPSKLKPKVVAALDGSDGYVPTIYDLITYEGYKALTKEHPVVAEAFKVHNNARGMQSARLVEGFAEYKREILKWSKAKVKAVNDVGGLRIFSFSDFEATHLIDVIQIIQDCAAKGVMIQGYTKVPEFAAVVRNTNLKLNRSLIAKGTGLKTVDGKTVLDLDPVEGIDITSPYFFDSTDSPNIGNILVGMSDEQIRVAMLSDFVDYIIPFHTGLKKSILRAKKIDHWTNYKNSQTDKDASTGRVADKQINIYVDVLQAAEAEGKPITNKVEFVNKFLSVCKERNVIPRFAQFLDVDADGNYVYTEGYHKFLLDFKLFDKDGNILPQMPVVPEFDDALNAKILNDYVRDQKLTADHDEVYQRIKREVIGESNVKHSGRYGDTEVEEILDDLENHDFQDPAIGENVKYSIRDSGKPFNPLRNPDGSVKLVYKAFYAMDGGLYPPMIMNQSDEDKKKVKNAASGTLAGRDTPVGVVLDAEVGKLARYSKDATEYEAAFRKRWSGDSEEMAQIKAELEAEGFVLSPSLTGEARKAAEEKMERLYPELRDAKGTTEYDALFKKLWGKKNKKIDQLKNELEAEGYVFRGGMPAQTRAAAEKKMEQVFPDLRSASRTVIAEKAGELVRNESGRLAVVNSKGGGTLAFRPGWHLGEWPNLTQFNVTDPVTGEKKSVMPDSLVFCACEIAGDVDYQLDAMELGMTPKGGFDRTQAGLPFVPVDGYYKYRTNADPTTAPWYITGSMRIVSILDDEDCRRICAQYGVTPQPRVSHKDIDLAAYGLKRGPVTPISADKVKAYKKSQKAIRNDAELREALEDADYQDAYVFRRINFDDAEIVKEFARNGQDVDYYRAEYAKRNAPAERRGVYSAEDNNVVHSLRTGPSETWADVTMGLNFRDSSGELLNRVFEGEKLYETRPYLGPQSRGIEQRYLNTPMGIVQTGAGPAKLVGFWELGDGEVKDAKWLNDHKAELGNDGTEFEAGPNDMKWVYPIKWAERTTPVPVTSRGYQARSIADVTKTLERDLGVLRSTRQNVQTAEEAVALIEKLEGKEAAKQMKQALRGFEQRAARAEKALAVEQEKHQAQRIKAKQIQQESNHAIRTLAKLTGDQYKVVRKELQQARKQLADTEARYQRTLKTLENERTQATQYQDEAVQAINILAKLTGDQHKLDQRELQKAQKKLEKTEARYQRVRQSLTEKLRYNARTDKAWARGYHDSATRMTQAEGQRRTKEAVRLERKAQSLPAKKASATALRFNRAAQAARMSDGTVEAKPTGYDPYNTAAKTTQNLIKRFTDKLSAGYRLLSNINQPIDNMAKLQTRDMTLSVLTRNVRASKGISTRFIEVGMLAKDGRIMGPSMEDLLLWHDAKGQVMPEMQRQQNEYMVHKHNVDRMTIKERAIQRVEAFLQIPENSWLDGIPDRELRLAIADRNPRAMEYVRLMRLAVEAQNKPVVGHDNGTPYTAEESQAVVDWYEENMPMIVEKAESIYDAWDVFMREWAVGAFMSEAQYQDMREMYPHYMPTYRQEKGGPSAGTKATPQGLSDGNPFKKATGSVRPLLPMEDEYVKSMQAIVRAARQNELKQNMIEEFLFDTEEVFTEFGVFDWEDADAATRDNFWDVLPNEEDESTAARLREVGLDKDGDRYKVTCMVDGVRMSAYITADVYKALSFLFDQQSDTYKKAVKMGNKVTGRMKQAITGKNPIFALRNIIRDLHTALANSVAGISFLKYWGRAWSQIATNDSNWVTFQNLGGTSATLENTETGFMESRRKPSLMPSTAKDLKTTAKAAVGKVGNVLGYMGEISESVTRFAEYLATLDMLGGDTYENRMIAISNAAEVTVDFGRRGSAGTIINSWCPYWNPAVQGLDKSIRNVFSEPTAAKRLAKIGRVALVNIIPAALAIIWNAAFKRDKDYEELSAQLKDQYYCFAVPGHEHKFFKVPRSQDYGALMSASLMRVMEGLDRRDNPDENFFRVWWESMHGFIKSAVKPMAPIPSPIFISDAIDLLKNENYAGAAIVPYNLLDVSAKEQWDEDTSWFAKKLGEAIGISPMATDYFINNYIGSFYGSLAKAAPFSPLKPIGLTTGEMDTADVWQETWRTLSSPLIADNRYSSSARANYYEMYGKLQQEFKDTDAHGDPKTDMEDYEFWKALTQTGGYAYQIRALTKQAQEMHPGDEKDSLMIVIGGLADEALDFYKAYKDGEVTDPIHYATYHRYGKQIMDATAKLDKYKDDFDFGGQLGMPEVLYDRSGEDAIKYILTGEQQLSYAAKRAEQYQILFDQVIASRTFQNEKPTVQAQLLEDAKRDALKKAEQLMAQEMKQNGVTGEVVYKSDWSYEEQVAAYELAQILGTDEAYSSKVTDTLIRLYDYGEDYNFAPTQSKRDTFTSPSDSGKYYELTSEQQKQYSELYHKAYESGFLKVANSAEFKSASAEQQAQMLAIAKTYIGKLVDLDFDDQLRQTGAASLEKTAVDEASRADAQYAVQRALGMNTSYPQELTDELVRLYDYKDDFSFGPVETAKSYFNDPANDTQRYVLDATQQARYSEFYHDVYEEYILKAMNASDWASLSDTEKASRLEKARGYVPDEVNRQFGEWITGQKDTKLEAKPAKDEVLSLDSKWAVQRALGLDDAINEQVTDELIDLYAYKSVGSQSYLPPDYRPTSYSVPGKYGYKWILDTDQKDVYEALALGIYEQDMLEVIHSDTYKRLDDYGKAQLLCATRAQVTDKARAAFIQWLSENNAPMTNTKTAEEKARQQEIKAYEQEAKRILGS